MNIKDFIKNNKIAVIAGSVVLAVAIASGVAFGVINHKNKVESKGFTPNGSSVSTGSDKSVSLPTDGSSKENTSGESSMGSDSTEAASSETTTSNETGNGSTIEVIPTPSKNSSTTSSKKPASKPSASSSQPTTPAASTPATSTPSNTVSSTPSKPSTSKWSCPDPSAHPEMVNPCLDERDHKSGIAAHQRKLEEANSSQTRTPEEIKNNCWICNKPFGDGHNGTCYNYFENGKYTCHHYD